jgi:hypothetical protein
MPRTRRLLIGVAIAALALGSAAWYLRADPAAERVTPARPAGPAPKAAAFAASPPSHRPKVVRSEVSKVPPVRKSPDYGVQYRHSSDLLAFIEALAPAAADGNVEALYYLAAASRRCTREYSTLFGPPGKEKGLEEAMEPGSWAKYYEHVARRMHAQCARFKPAADNAFTEWENLMQAAAEAGSGPAKAVLAFELQQGMNRLSDPAAREAQKTSIRTLAKEAIRTKDPQVLFQLASVETITGNSGTPADVASIWMLAACQRGLACGTDTEHFEFFCRWDPACQPTETLVDLFRRREGANFDEVQRRANELSEKLDADRFDEIIPQ